MKQSILTSMRPDPIMPIFAFATVNVLEYLEGGKFLNEISTELIIIVVVVVAAAIPYIYVVYQV